MLKHSHDGAQSAKMKWGSKSTHGSGTTTEVSLGTKAPFRRKDKNATSGAYLVPENGSKHRFVSDDRSASIPPFQRPDPFYDEFMPAPSVALNDGDSMAEISTDTNLPFPGKLPYGVRSAKSPIGPCQSFQPIHQENCTGAVVYAPPDPPQHENAAADGPRNGVKCNNKAGQLPANDTASAAARHPIIALHWGIVA